MCALNMRDSRALHVKDDENFMFPQIDSCVPDVTDLHTSHLHYSLRSLIKKGIPYLHAVTLPDNVIHFHDSAPYVG